MRTRFYVIQALTILAPAVAAVIVLAQRFGY